MVELVTTLAAIVSVAASLAFLWHFYGDAIKTWWRATVCRYDAWRAETELLNRMWEATE